VIVLDTHAWVWWLDDPGRLPRRARRAVAQAADDRAIYVSSISAWEVAQLAARDRLRFTMAAGDWVGHSEALPFLHFVPVDNAIALRSVGLPEPFHKDPADRIVVATAIILGASIVTSDRRMIEYPHIETIWA
jgi:PIN domain nuclease of toxin-antitoxin system